MPEKEKPESRTNRPIAVPATSVPPRKKKTAYPPPFASRVEGREKRKLGDFFGLKNFGVNLTRLAPGASSALRHAHSVQDEWIYVLEGNPTLVTDEGETLLSPGMCAGFRGGDGNAHHLVNKTEQTVAYIEVGDRSPGDEASYPDDDLVARLVDGRWEFFHKDGRPYGEG
ncbi:MAG TPA: cupin domain-containing protein [Planctomycetes bacterium]|nr:cupin domain-containing protein [Planctomycetota bacterium]